MSERGKTAPKVREWECCRDHAPQECKARPCAYCATIQTALRTQRLRREAT